MKTRYDAVIIGAGPAGSTAAILLAQAGWSVAIVEKQPFPRRKVCGECIAAPNLQLLDGLGLDGAFNALAGAPLQRVALFAGPQQLYADLPAYEAGPYRWGKALGREYFDSLLLQRAADAGATVWQPCSVRNVDGEPGNFRCTVAMAGTTETLTAPVVIAAHGSWEAAPYAQAHPAKRPGDLFGFKANYRGATLAPGTLPVLALAGGYGGMVVGNDGLLTLACCIRRDVLAACRRRYGAHTAAQAVEAYLAAQCDGVAAALSSAEREGAWLSVGPLRPGVRLAAGDDKRPFAIGNAAGEAHPIIGEGISMAMQSAWLLSRHLTARSGDPEAPGYYRELRRAYARDWRRHFVPRLRLASALAHAAMHPAATTLACSVLRRWPALLTHGARYGGKVRSAVEMEAPAIRH